jgi:hypothetical protein
LERVSGGRVFGVWSATAAGEERKVVVVVAAEDYMG